MTTITDVAEKAGVSVKTVSRVMNNYEHISAKTRTRVEAAMRDLNYAPRSMVRPLSNSGSLSIGVVYGDPSSGYQARLNHAFLQACSHAERYLAVEIFDEASRNWRAQLEGFLERTQVKHVILVPPLCDSSDLHELLRQRQISFVLLSPSSPVSGVTTIAMDDRLASKQIIKLLIDLGHQRIGHISGRPDHVVTLLRRQGYEEALHIAGLPLRDGYIQSGRFSFKEALSCAERMLCMPEPPTAIFAANDEMAAAVVMTANRMGLRVPEDLSVVGFDDAPIAQTIWPALTTVAQPYDDFARSAIDALSEPVVPGPQQSQTLILKHEIVVRGSTGAVPVA